jgi:proteasome accessory factor B
VATDRTERLLNLVLCLLGARRAVPRSALQASVPGYADAVSAEAFERMFERDKDELRSMGIPVETVVNAAGEVEGYLIDEGSYALPDIRLDASELATLGLAARMWSGAALGAHVTTALRKIEATTGASLGQPPFLVDHPAPGEAHLPLLWEAIRARHVVSFAYRARGRDAMETRVVEPWATVRWQGAWYVVGMSRERKAPRAFRLSRIHGSVTIKRDVFDMVEHREIATLIEQLADPPASGSACVSLPVDGGLALRARARPRSDGYWDVDYADEDAFLGLALEAGATCVEPSHLATRQAEALRRVRDLHEAPHA